MRANNLFFLALALLSVNAFATSGDDNLFLHNENNDMRDVTTKIESSSKKEQMSQQHIDLLKALKSEALKNDPVYMETHKDEALALSLLSPSDGIPPRTPDKYVKILFLPYVSDGIYKGASVDVYKHKDGKFVLANELEPDGGEDVLNALNSAPSK